MKKAFIGIAACAAAVVVALAAVFLAPGVALADGGTAMWRLYNPNSGEHFYTASASERNNVVNAGWHLEGVGWWAPSTGTPVYRVYNPNGGDHHYTTSAGERDLLVKAGWRNEGVGWQSGGSVAVHRLYNPKAATGAHHYTTSAGERDLLVAAGWSNEGVAWYGVSVDNSARNAQAHSLYKEYCAQVHHEEILGSGMSDSWDIMQFAVVDANLDGVDELVTISGGQLFNSKLFVVANGVVTNVHWTTYHTFWSNGLISSYFNGGSRDTRVANGYFLEADNSLTKVDINTYLAGASKREVAYHDNNAANRDAYL